MSKKDFTVLIGKIKSDQKYAKELFDTLAKNPEHLKVIGFDGTLDDFKAQCSGELTDEELSAIAGGSGGSNPCTKKASCRHYGLVSWIPCDNMGEHTIGCFQAITGNPCGPGCIACNQ